MSFCASASLQWNARGSRRFLIAWVTDSAFSPLWGGGKLCRMKLKRVLACLPVVLLIACQSSESGLPDSCAARQGDAVQRKPTPKVQRGFEYICREGDFLTAIAHAYRDAGVKVTVEDIIAANPGIDPEHLTPGQKMFIPIPENSSR